jgi:RNA polymerase sigma-70 factor (ECF subfamily)
VSEVMTVAYNKIDTYDPKWHISTWIYRIAYTHSCMELRNRKKRKVTFMTDVENSENKNLLSKIEFDSIDSYVDDLVAIEDKREHEDNLTRLRTLFSTLPEDYRVVIEEKIFNDLKYEEIAEKLEIPLHTVKNRISRGKRILKEQYEM